MTSLSKDSAADPHDPVDKALPRAGRAPVGTASAAVAGGVAAVALTVLGAIALRDTAVVVGWIQGSLWIDATVEWIDGLSFQTWMIPAGTAAVVIGLILVIVALTPRRTRVLAVRATSSVWMSTDDLARLATAAAHTVAGVLDVRSDATGRKITVTAQVTDTDGAVAGEIERAVRRCVHPVIVSDPAVHVRIHTGRR